MGTRRKTVSGRRARSTTSLPKSSAARAKARLASPMTERHVDDAMAFAVRLQQEADRYIDLYHFAPVAYARLDPNGVVAPGKYGIM